MAAAIHTVQLTHASICEDEVGRFRFTRPEGYGLLAGQFFSMTLTTAAGPVAHLLSIASTPAEDHLEICTRLTGSPFKEALLALEPGDAVEVSDARGALRLPADARAAVFIAGGVGIAPARSLLVDAAHGPRRPRLVLFQADRSPRCMPYADEFSALSDDDALLWVPVLSRIQPGWRGETGHITAQLLERHLPADLGHACWVLTGPPAMVAALQEAVAELDVPADDVVVERLTGYE